MKYTSTDGWTEYSGEDTYPDFRLVKRNATIRGTFGIREYIVDIDDVESVIHNTFDDQDEAIAYCEEYFKSSMGIK